MFDRFVVADWSANSTPKQGRDSIWIAVADAAGVTTLNPATRAEAEARLHDIVDASAGVRTLIGIDVSLGCPSGTAAALGLAGDHPWRSTVEALSALVTDDDRNTNNRFAVAAELNARMTGGPGPFWGCPPRAASATLAPTKPSVFEPVAEWRTVEEVLRSQGRRPFSVWQLLGAGAVGGQSLLGIPMVNRLLQRWPARVAVWPTTTGLTVPEPVAGSVVIAEVWPSMMEPMSVDAGEVGHMVRDERQVCSTVAWMVELGATGALESLFTPDVADAIRPVVEREEGWVLGVTL
ncbi:MAG TPA: hypothetical protein VK860_15025 [Ilumatobacteraceae bacterium]|nr:hypothetical protein [Ilumatobacteraceae bacterium]